MYLLSRIISTFMLFFAASISMFTAVVCESLDFVLYNTNFGSVQYPIWYSKYQIRYCTIHSHNLKQVLYRELLSSVGKYEKGRLISLLIMCFSCLDKSMPKVLFLTWLMIWMWYSPLKI